MDHPPYQRGQDGGQSVAFAGVVREGEVTEIEVENQIEPLINFLLGRLFRDRRGLDRGTGKIWSRRWYPGRLMISPSEPKRGAEASNSSGGKRRWSRRVPYARID